MLIGHYAVAFGAKRFARATSLGTLFAAAALLDLVWPVLVLAGVEKVEVTRGATAVTPLTFISYPWSHSLLMSAVWGALFGLGYWLVRKNRSGGAVIFLLVVSHWLLDWIVHVPDLPVTPWSGAREGLALWNSLPFTLITELTLFAAGTWIYFHVTKAKDGIGRWGSLALCVLLLGLYASAIFGPPPPSANIVAWTDLGQWLLVPFAFWVDAHRVAPGRISVAAADARARAGAARV